MQDRHSADTVRYDNLLFLSGTMHPLIGAFMQLADGNRLHLNRVIICQSKSKTVV